MVLYGLKSQIGTVYRNTMMTTSYYDVGNFLYLAGGLDFRFWGDFVIEIGFDYKRFISKNTNIGENLHRKKGLKILTRNSFIEIRQIFKLNF